MQNQAHRQKKISGRFRLPPQANGALKNYSISRSGYRSVRFLDTKCTVGIAVQSVQKIWSTLNFMLQENASSWQCVELMNKRTYVSFIHMAIVTTIYLI